jgi:hypothetical protein
LSCAALARAGVGVLRIIASCKNIHGISLPFQPVGDRQIFMLFDTLSQATQPSQGDNHDAF